MTDDELQDMAASACQEALSFGVSEDAFMRLARSVRERCAKACDDYADAYPSTARNARANRRAAKVLAAEIRGQVL